MTRHDLTIRLPGITLTPVNYSFGLPPGYSMQRVMDQVAGATFTPDDYRDLYYPSNAVRLSTGTLFEVLSYVLWLIPEYSLETLDAVYRDLEVKAWENCSHTTGLPVDPKRRISVTALSRGILSI